MSFNMETTGDEVVKTFAAEAKGKTGEKELESCSVS